MLNIGLNDLHHPPPLSRRKSNTGLFASCAVHTPVGVLSSLTGSQRPNSLAIIASHFSVTIAMATEIVAILANAPSGTIVLPLRIRAGLRGAGSAARISRPVPHSA